MEHLFAVQYAWLIPLLPLIGAAVAGFFGARWLKGLSHWPIWLTVGASAVISVMLLVGMIGHMPHEASQPVVIDGQVKSIQPRDGEQFLREAFAVSVTRTIYTWISAGSFRADVSFFLDPLTAVMLCVVTGIGFFITVFARGYMAGETGYFRFFAYLGLFIFAMTMLVMGDNLVLLYLGWEGVGLCSYLLIGYYYDKPAAREAAKKAFLVNRIGDFGFGLGIMLLFTAFGTVSYFGQPGPTPDGVLELAMIPRTDFQRLAVQWAPFLLMLGAFGKSAQFPLYVWLPDAMEGPTPVSALIHAATMVTAGVYMIVRCGTLFVGNAAAMALVAAVGIFTALFAATIALRQYDLKKVFAYSTISQLGFMFVGAGLLAPVSAIFHLVTHAFFKALLFLSSGVVMHAMMGHLDMRRMSGLRRILPKTNILMLIGCMALSGVPFLAGFFSKDEIVIYAWYYSKPAGALLLLTAFLTAYYTFRLYFRVFQGPLVQPAGPAEGHGHDNHAGHSDDHHPQSHVSHGSHNHEPWVMIVPLVVLALGAVLAGYLNWPERHASLGGFLGQSPSLLLARDVAQARVGPSLVPVPFGAEEYADGDVRERMHALHTRMMAISALIACLGIYVAYLLDLKYRDQGEALARRYPRVARLLEARYWVDEIYQAGIVEPLRRLGAVFFAIDRYVVDGLVTGFGLFPMGIGTVLKVFTQRGSLQGYALLMLLGVVVIVFLVLR